MFSSSKTAIKMITAVIPNMNCKVDAFTSPRKPFSLHRVSQLSFFHRTMTTQAFLRMYISLRNLYNGTFKSFELTAQHFLFRRQIFRIFPIRSGVVSFIQKLSLLLGD
ncbi:unnamed protein product [Acanthoscelides obtectus]|uniref:Uncharacterized protein n=1 Tax=Acanthoscelides obtectus TaxID=200917 RepID=A0A9P0K236_ACAOB|nr:unnamed protein product [Acanthoscelides obtectus]